MSTVNEPRLRIDPKSLPWREVDGEIVALDLASSTYFTINGSGAVLWRALSDGATRSDLVAALVDRYEIEHELAEVDVDDFIASCRANDILRGE
jgi:hypothetical protein